VRTMQDANEMPDAFGAAPCENGRRPSLASLLVHGLYERVQYPSLLLTLVAFWLVLAGFFGSTTVGFPYLFWHAQAEIAVCASLAIGVVLGEWGFVNFLLDSDRPWLRKWVAHRSDQHVLMRYLFFMNLLFAAAFLPTPFFYRVGGDRAQFDLVRACMSATGIVTGVSIYVCLVSFVAIWTRGDCCGMPRIRALTERSLKLLQGVRQGRGEPRQGERGVDRSGRARRSRDGELPPVGVDMVWVHVASGLFFGLWIVMLIGAAIVYANVETYPPWLDAVLSPAVLVCMLLVLGIRIYGFLVFHVHRLYFGLLAGGVLMMMGLGYYDWLGHKYPLPDMPPRSTYPTVDEVLRLQQERLARLESGQDLDTDRLALEKWLELAEDSGEPAILVVVATSGGGIRAQIWTTAVLGAVERMIPEFPYRTRVVTGASGGMVGAAYYVGTLEPPAARWGHGQDGQPLPVERLVEISSHDSLTPTARTLCFRDLPRQILPFLGGRDRGETLQRTWIRNSGGESSAYRRPLRDLEAGEMAGWCPSLIFTPALLEDGRRLFMSNLTLAPLTVSHMPRPTDPSDRPPGGSSLEYDEAMEQGEAGTGGEQRITLSGIEARIIEDRLNYRFDLATAARLNATFPMISPPIAMPVDRVQWSLGDAAYYDNYGMNVAVRWLERHRDLLTTWRQQRRLQGVLVLQIISSEDPRESKPASEPKWSDGWMTPVTGFLVNGFQKIVHSSDEQLATMAKSFPDDPSEATPFFRHETITFRGDASLSWYLTPEEVYALVYPFERMRDGGQLDFDRRGTPEFQRQLGRASEPTDGMVEFRREMQVQLGALHRWWSARSALAPPVPDRRLRSTDADRIEGEPRRRWR